MESPLLGILNRRMIESGV